MVMSRAAVFAAALLATAAPAAAAPNLVQNGDFQTGSFSGWTNVTNASLVQVDTNWIAVVGGQLQQTMTVVNNVVYRLSFDFMRNVSSTPGSFTVQVSSFNPSLNNITATNWTKYVYDFKVMDGQGMLNFNFNNLKVDNISVTAVPGPIAGAGLPLLAGFAGYAAWRRRRAPRAA